MEPKQWITEDIKRKKKSETNDNEITSIQNLCSTSSSKKQVYNNTKLPQEKKKNSNKLPNLTPKANRERRISKTQSQQKERNHKDQSRRN